MHETTGRSVPLPVQVCERALDARDSRFDGLFFVGIITTRIYCRPVCPARVSRRDHRRFFASAAAAERAGFRPCLRCRPELAPGRALVDALPRLAHAAGRRIGEGALNGRSVRELAAELAVSERHLRRAMQRELGVSPVELAQTHRLLLAKQLLTDTSLSVSRIAFASGFQSLRRFNASVRERYRMSPTVLRRGALRNAALRRARVNGELNAEPESDMLRLTLSYRVPFAWNALLTLLHRGAVPGVEIFTPRGYGRTVRLADHRGIVIVGNAHPTPEARRPGGGEPSRVSRASEATTGTHLTVDLSTSLLPVLMPLLGRLRRLFDLDAQPTVIDEHLERGGLGALVRARPGVRVPGAFEGFDAACRELLRDAASGSPRGRRLAARIARTLGEPVDTQFPGLDRLAPDPARIAEAGAPYLVTLGVERSNADAIVAVARGLEDGTLRLGPGSDVVATRLALTEIGVSHRLATMIVMRALHWPDAFPVSDRSLQRAAGLSDPCALRTAAEPWRPWRAYAATHLWLRQRSSSRPARRFGKRPATMAR